MKKNRQLIFILSIVALALFLRLFRISSYMTFLGDEGRDALVWLRMTHGKFTLIGPQTSIGNMYLGPLFYYLMLPFYLVLGTVGPSVGTALFAGATTFLLWLFGREWFSSRVGLISAFFYAISPVAIELSRSSWNPNVMPFFALVTVWGVWQFWQKGKYLWLPVAGVALSFAIQSHYLGMLLIPIVGLFWLVKIIDLKKKKDSLRLFIYCSILLLVCFLVLTVLPLVWFDLRHQFLNYQSFYKFFSERQTTVNFRPYKAIPNLWPLWQTLVTRLIAGKNEVFGLWVSAVSGIVMLGSLTVLIVKKKYFSNKALVLLTAWTVIGLLGMGLYKQHIYDHYFGFLFPAVFLLFAVFLEKLMLAKKIGKMVFILIFTGLLFLNLVENPLKRSPNQQYQHTAEVDGRIVKEAKGEPFNLGMIAKQNYDAGYRYFLEKQGFGAIEIDAQRSEETITDQLFVVCEIEDCRPVGHPQAEIANFGWSEIEQEWVFPWGTRLFKLVHYSGKQ